MIMHVLEKYSKCMVTGYQKMEAVGPNQILCAHQSDCLVPYNLESLHFSCILSFYYR